VQENQTLHKGITYLRRQGAGNVVDTEVAHTGLVGRHYIPFPILLHIQLTILHWFGPVLS